MKHFVKQFVKLLALLCLVATPAMAQGARHNDIALGRDGHVAPGASIAVCTAQAIIGYGNSPCSPLATIYTDGTLATPAANPFLADSNGDYGFWAPPGTYQVQIYGAQIGTYIETVTVPCVPNAAATGCGSAAISANNTWTGANTFGADAYFKSGEPWFDVKAFGAKCDDSTDDTAAIQATLAAIPPTGGLVMIPGVCKFTSTLVINTPDVTLEGKGHFQFITQNAPVTYLDYQGATGNAILVSAQGFKMRDVGVKYPTTIGGPLAPPPAPTLSQVAGTGCPAEPYYVEATYLNAQGETSDSAEATFTTTAGNCLRVQSPPMVAGATGWNLYVSTNSNNETKQNSSPLAIGTSWTFGGTLVNLAYRPPFNTTAYSAIYDNNGAQLDGVKIFTDADSSAGSASMANGYTGFGCCGKLRNVYVAGFGVGVAGAGSNNDFSVTGSFIQSNYVGAFIVNGADINIVRDDFEGNVAGNIKMLYGSPYTLSHNYFEQQGTNPPSYNVQVGDTSIPPQGFAPTPGAVFIDGNFMQCNLTAYPPAPIVIDTAASLDIEKNSFSQCGNQNIIANFAGAGATIKILGNISDHAPLSWITSENGVTESDLSGAAMTPGTPFFYGLPAQAGLGVDSVSGASSLLFRSGGANAWNIGATPSALSFGFNGHLGESAMQLAPFGSQTYASVQSNYAMDAAEELVTQSGSSAAFDAGLGNTFEIALTANVTSSTLVNAQAGQWLAFIICQSGSGGPYTFAWPSNVFGGGTIGAVGGNCSAQTFYVSGGNAWAVAPMMQNLSTGTNGLSLPAVAGTVPYFTGAWASGNCLEAGGSPGLISVASSACGTGGGGGSGLFGSFQVGTNSPITSAGNYFQLAAGSNVTLGWSGAGTSANPYVATITGGNTAATAWSAITGSATNVNTGFALSPTATGTVPWIINCPSAMTVDCFDVQSNGAASFSVNDAGDSVIGPPAVAHALISPGSISFFQTDGTTLLVPSIAGSTGAGTAPGTGQEGFAWNADDLPHPYIGGVDLGAAPVTLSGVTDTSDAYASTSPVASLVTGQQFCFNPITSNTTATPTLNVNSLGAITITKYGGMTLAAGDLKAAHESCVIYNGTTMDLVSEAANGPSDGTIAISASTTGTHTFSVAYSTAPVCVVSPEASPSAVGVYWVTSLTTSVTVTVATSGTLTFNFHCAVANN